MTTETVTLNSHIAHAQVTLRSKAIEPVDLTHSMNELTFILLKFKFMKDPLSLKIFTWGAKVLQFVPENREFSSDVQKESIKHIENLVNRILVNSLDEAPLKKPLLDQNGLVWNQWMWTLYHNHKQTQFQAEPHFFAQEMLVWIQSLPINITLSETSKVLLDPALAKKPETASIISLGLEALIKIAQINQKISKEYKEVRQQSLLSKKLRSEMDIFIAKQREEDEKNAIQAEQNLKQSLQNTLQAHQAIITVLNSRISHGLEEIKATNERLEHSENIIAKHQEEIQKILQDELIQAQKGLVEEEKLKQKIEGIQKTHQETYNILSSRVSELEIRQENTQLQLDAAQDTCRQQAGEIQSLRYAYASRSQEIQDLANRGSGGGGCICM